MNDAALIWGDLPLTVDDATGLDWWLEVSADGTSWGNPDAVVTVIQSHLQDGSLAEVSSYNNRQATIQVRVCSMTYEGLGDGETALLAQENAPGYNTLTWTPSRSRGIPTVFDVVYAEVRFDLDDLSETSERYGTVLRRAYPVTLECLPHGRDAEPTTVQLTSTPTVPVTPTITVVNDASSPTSWSANGLGSSFGGVYRCMFPSHYGRQLHIITYSGGITTTTDKFLLVDYSVGANSNEVVEGSFDAYVNGSPLVMLATVPSPYAGFTRGFYQVPASVTSIPVVEFRQSLFENVAQASSIAVTEISTSNVGPYSGTERQKMRSLTIGGSRRAPVSLAISAPAGEVLGRTTVLYTNASGSALQPPLRRWRVSSSSVTGDTSLVSGAFNAIGSPMTFLIPANLFAQAAHCLGALLTASTSGIYSLTVTASVASSTNADVPETAPLTVVDTIPFAIDVANAYQFIDLGTFQMPSLVVAADSTYMVRLTIQGSSSTLLIDEGWLFDLDNGALSVVQTTGLTRLEVRTPDLTNPEPSYWGGAADGGGPTALVRADHRALPMDHKFPPGLNTVFTVTSGTTRSACTATYYRRHAHHASTRRAS